MFAPELLSVEDYYIQTICLFDKEHIPIEKQVERLCDVLPALKDGASEDV